MFKHPQPLPVLYAFHAGRSIYYYTGRSQDTGRLYGLLDVQPANGARMSQEGPQTVKGDMWAVEVVKSINGLPEPLGKPVRAQRDVLDEVEYDWGQLAGCLGTVALCSAFYIMLWFVAFS